MRPDRQKTVCGRKVEEFFWGGALVVYVDNHAVQTSFDTTCETIESGQEPKWSGPKPEPAPTSKQRNFTAQPDNSRERVRMLLHHDPVLLAAVCSVRIACEQKRPHEERDQVNIDIAQILITYAEEKRRTP